MAVFNLLRSWSDKLTTLVKGGNLLGRCIGGGRGSKCVKFELFGRARFYDSVHVDLKVNRVGG